MNKASCHPLNKTKTRAQTAPAGARRLRSRARYARRNPRPRGLGFPSEPWRLFDLHLRANVLELLLDDFDVALRNGFLDRRGHALDQVLGFLEAETGDLADHFDDGDLLVRRILLEGDGEFRVLRDRRRRRAARSPARP